MSGPVCEFSWWKCSVCDRLPPVASQSHHNCKTLDCTSGSCVVWTSQWSAHFESVFCFSIAGHKWDGAHREAGLAECHDLCHSHLQVLWDLTSAPPPPCSCSAVGATPALLSSQQPFNATINCYTSLTPPPPHTTVTPSHAACLTSVFSNNKGRPEPHWMQQLLHPSTTA